MGDTSVKGGGEKGDKSTEKSGRRRRPWPPGGGGGRPVQTPLWKREPGHRGVEKRSLGRQEPELLVLSAGSPRGESMGIPLVNFMK